MFMLLQELSKIDDLDRAAQLMANNYLSWKDFAYFGSYGRRIMLGYTINHFNHSFADQANHEVLLKAFEPWLGNDENSLVTEFKSSVHGDLDMLVGFKIVVYDEDGKITEPFRRAHLLAHQLKNGVLSMSKLKEVTRRLLMEYMSFELKSVCEAHGIDYEPGLIAPMADLLLEDTDESDPSSFDIVWNDRFKNYEKVLCELKDIPFEKNE